MENNFSNKVVFLGDSIPDESHYLRQLIGFCAGVGTKYLDNFSETITYLITENLEHDIKIIASFLDTTSTAKNKKTAIVKRLNSLQILSVSQLLEVLENTPAKYYIK